MKNTKSTKTKTITLDKPEYMAYMPAIKGMIRKVSKQMQIDTNDADDLFSAGFEGVLQALPYTQYMTKIQRRRYCKASAWHKMVAQVREVYRKPIPLEDLDKHGQALGQRSDPDLIAIANVAISRLSQNAKTLIEAANNLLYSGQKPTKKNLHLKKGLPRRRIDKGYEEIREQVLSVFA